MLPHPAWEKQEEVLERTQSLAASVTPPRARTFLTGQGPQPCLLMTSRNISLLIVPLKKNSWSWVLGLWEDAL